jgi:hypothetical protein
MNKEKDWLNFKKLFKFIKYKIRCSLNFVVKTGKNVCFF